MRIPGNPYAISGAIFLAIILGGFYFFYWRETELAFAVLLYLLVTMGIRLDEISRQLGSFHDRPTRIPDDHASVADHLDAIRKSSANMETTLSRILENLENRNR